MSIGERIKGARIMAQMSQRDLADTAGVSAMAISKYERGLDIPGSSVLIRLAKALGVKVEYFFRSTTVALSPHPQRQQESLPSEQSASILEQAQEWLERYVDVENLLDAGMHYKPLSKQRIKTIDEIEEVALNVREEWRLGFDPIESLIEICEDRGIKVGIIDGPENFDALTLWTNNAIPVFILQRDIPGDYQRLCIAREIGYLVLEATEQLDQSMAVHRFARCLIAPQSAVELELGQKRHSISLYELNLLKHKYGLSMQTWIERARDLKILSEKDATQLFSLFRQRNWNHEEPGSALPSEIPQRFKQLVMHALCEGIISQARAAELLGVHLSDFLGGEIEGHGGLPIELCG
jgi:transcriptional regulator with XRE-family HTH domain/Zn-dependent peptidase ImmA (M78 family)